MYNSESNKNIANLRRKDMNRPLTVSIQQDGDWFVAKCLENNVASQGKTMDEAIENLREALTLFFEGEAPPVYSQTYVTTLQVAI
jgi:predicted RNase H-like HicB family nuclease